MEIPKDVIYGEVLLRILENYEIIIENHKGILLYTDEEIAIACKKYTIRVYGNALNIQYFSGSSMKIVGTIKQIEYISNGVI